MTTATLDAPPAAEEIKHQALSIVEQAGALAVRNADDYARAGELLLAIKGVRAKIDAAFDPIVAAAHQAHKVAVAQKKAQDEPLARAEAIIKPRMSAWAVEEERKRQAEQARLQAEADKKAHEEAVAAAKARAKAEAEALAAARRLEKAGDAAGAQAVLDEAAAVPPPPPPMPAPAVVVPSAVPRVAGVAPVKRWTFEITDRPAAIRAALANPALSFLVTLDETAMGRLVTAQKGAFHLPGVRAFQSSGIAAAARR